ncbi:MAG: fibronectin type III domain-containing protein [Saprospiraceae bacterium]|nr:fibronectin type III domain-containing protein [Saprospiraceae bacterium]
MSFLLRFLRASAAVMLLLPNNTLIAQTLKPLPALIDQYHQQGVIFESASPFGPAASSDVAADRFARGAQHLTIDQSFLAQIVATRPEALSIQVPWHGEMMTLELIQSDPLTPDFKVETSESEGQAVSVHTGVHYRGILRGDVSSLAAFSFFEDHLAGLFSSPKTGNMVLGKLETPGNTANYILYADRQLTASPGFECHTPDQDPFDEIPTEQLAPDVNGCVRVFFEADYALFQNKGSVQATVDYLSAVFNQLATLYANESISTRLSQLFIWTTPDAYSTTSSSSALTQFQSFRSSFDADIAHLVGIGGNNLGGIAYVDVLCFKAYSYAYSDITPSYANVPTYSWTIEVLTHEMGHNLGSNHTQWCGWSGGALDNCYSTEGGCPPGPPPSNGGTIMSYCHLSGTGINFSNGFGTQPGNKIRNEVGSATCLATSCAPSNGCNPPSAITVNNITGSGATISWTGVNSATSYSLQWRAVGNGAWTTISNAVSPQVLTGLPANDEIEVTLRSNCNANNSGYVNGVIFKTGTSGGGGGGGGGTCGVPANFSATATTATTASASWSAVNGASSYRISWKTASSGTWGTEVTVSGTAYNITGLTPNTSYNARVRTNCNGTFSAYATTTFSTPASGGGGGGSCGTPTGLSANNISYNKATISWSPSNGALSYDLQIKKASSSNWTTFAGLPVIVVQVTGLQANTAYQVRVRAKCSGNTYSAYSSVVNFNTLAYLPNQSLANAENGIESRSDQLRIDMGEQTAGAMLLAPNPANERTAVFLSVPHPDTRLELLDGFGKTLQIISVPENQDQSALELEALPAGLYFVRNTTSGQVCRLVKH